MPNQFTAREACDPSESSLSKFGGLMKNGKAFFIQFTFKTPILMKGYGLKVADEGLDPKKWAVYADVVDSESNEILENYK